MPYDTESQSRNVLASPLGEEGHEVAKGVQANWIHRGAPRPANPVRRHPAKSVCTRVRMIMILDVDVTAERRHYKTHRPKGRYHNPRPERPSSLRTLRTFGAARQPSRRRRVQRRSRHHNPSTQPFYTTCRVSGAPSARRAVNLSLHNPSTQPATVRRPQPSVRRAVNLSSMNPLNPRAEGAAPCTIMI